MTTDSSIGNVPVQRRWLTRERLGIYSAALLAVQVILVGIWAIAHWGWHAQNVPPLGIDFRVYWSASYVTLHEGALAAFDLDKLIPIQAQLLADTAIDPVYTPWVYPPNFQLLIYPLALLPYSASYALFMCASMGCCFLACVPVVRNGALPWVSVLAFPGIWIATIYGQNSLLTLGLAAGALALVERRPVMAGICAGMLAIKPQLVPIFLLLFFCGRHFRAVSAMVVTWVLFSILSGLIFGFPLWLKFFETASWFTATAVERGGDSMWRGMSTVFALLRQLGASISVAYTFHAAIAVVAIGAAAILWIRNAPVEVRSTALVTTTLLVQPYLMYYDLAWLILPICNLSVDRARHGIWNRAERLAMMIAWISPIPVLVAFFEPPVGQWGLLLLSKWGLLGLLLLFIVTTRHALKPSVLAANS